MRKIAWAIFALFLLSFLTGCGTHSAEDVAISGKNESRDNVELTISVGGISHTTTFGPNSSKSYVIEIPIARPPVRYGGYYGPSQVDRVTDIQVSAFNRDAGVSSRTQICQAGAKVTTSIVYANYTNDRAGFINCSILDAYGNIVDPKNIDPTYVGVANKEDGSGSQ